VFVRAAHLLAASAVAGACLFRVEDPAVRGWWIAASASGVVLLAIEIARHRGLLREAAGFATILKLVLVAGIALRPAAAPWLISAAFVVAVLGAHFPRRIRHRRLY
jgi:hypothetical protein